MSVAVAGEPITGSWWGHPQGKRIVSILEQLTAPTPLPFLQLI
jgi:hypothetical protein